MVIVSSNSPLGCNPDPSHRFNEDSLYNPYQHYGRSKMIMEQRVKEKAKEIEEPYYCIAQINLVKLNSLGYLCY